MFCRGLKARSIIYHNLWAGLSALILLRVNGPGALPQAGMVRAFGAGSLPIQVKWAKKLQLRNHGGKIQNGSHLAKSI
jgi:hypothetical protein